MKPGETYRLKIEDLTEEGQGVAKVGFYKPKSHEIVNVKGCKIAPIDMDEVIEFAKQNVEVKCDLIIKEAKGTDEEMIVSSCQGAKLEVIAGPGN